MDPSVGDRGNRSNCVESPSGSMRCSGMSTRIDPPDSTRPISGSGSGSRFASSSSGVTVNVAVAAAVSPYGSSTR
jgi:hypothetical protein